MIRNKIILVITIILLGIVSPFLSYFIVFEIFFLLIPFAIFFLVSLIYLIVSLINNSNNKRKALFIFLLLPVFIISQFISSLTLDNIQRFRSNQIIAEIEKLKTENGNYPKKYTATFGIEYIKIEKKEYYFIKYSKEFMITQEYNSRYKNWRSYDWND